MEWKSQWSGNVDGKKKKVMKKQRRGKENSGGASIFLVLVNFQTPHLD
jgi:hypothetical protein